MMPFPAVENHSESSDIQQPAAVSNQAVMEGQMACVGDGACQVPHQVASVEPPQDSVLSTLAACAAAEPIDRPGPHHRCHKPARVAEMSDLVREKYLNMPLGKYRIKEWQVIWGQRFNLPYGFTRKDDLIDIKDIYVDDATAPLGTITLATLVFGSVGNGCCIPLMSWDGKLICEPLAARQAYLRATCHGGPINTGPRATLSESNFKTCYDEARPVRDHSAFFAEVRGFMHLYIKKYHPTMSQAEIDTFVSELEADVKSQNKTQAHEIAACAWTAPNEVQAPDGSRVRFYSSLNATLRQDDSGEIMTKVARIARTQNRFIVKRNHSFLEKVCNRVTWPEDWIINRGSWMPRSEVSDFYRPGLNFRVPQYVAGSDLRDVAENFIVDFKPKDIADKVPVLFRIRIDPDSMCEHINYFEHVTLVRTEKEYVFPPYSPFQVIDVEMPFHPTDNDPVVISLQAHPDSHQGREDWPSARWV